MRSGRGHLFAGSIMCAAITCVVVAALASAGSTARVSTPGVTYSLVGSVAGFSVAGRNGAPMCQTPVPHFCYTPAMIQGAYDFPTGRGAPTGAGQTIVVVVAFGSATLESDLAAFDSLFGIPSTTLTYCGALNGQNPDPNFPSWAVETSADVEYAHAMAPGARIVLVVSPSDDVSTIAATEAACLPQYPGAIVSQSFGDDENDPDPSAQAGFVAMHKVFKAATRRGGSILAGSGDFGATDGQAAPVAFYPASDPLVTGVGGTEGKPYPGGLVKASGGSEHGRNDSGGSGSQNNSGGNGSQNNSGGKGSQSFSYGGEQVWNEPDFGAGTGGAPSILYTVPSYQEGVNGSSARTVPDVAFNAAINGGVLIVFGSNVLTFGGTSAGPPQWAGIFALANEARAAAGVGPLGQANTALYKIAADKRTYKNDFHDIVVGNNAVGGTPGFSAGPGYDLPTGLGTPDVANLIGDLAKAPSDQQDDDHGSGQGQGGSGGNSGGNSGGDSGHGQHHHMQPG
jgi:subtilase family serine protease